MDHRDGADRLIGSQDGASRIHDLPSGCLDLPLPLMKGFRLLLVVLGIKYHQIDQPSHQRQNDCSRADEYYEYLFLVIRFILHIEKTSQKPFL